jgi:hypothetical protein
MKNESRNAWIADKHDTLFNGGLIATGIVGILLGLLEPTMPNASPLVRVHDVAGLVVAETSA